MIARKASVVLLWVAITSACLAAGDARNEKPIRIVLVGDSTVASYAHPPKDRPDDRRDGDATTNDYRDPGRAGRTAKTHAVLDPLKKPRGGNRTRNDLPEQNRSKRTAPKGGAKRPICRFFG
jgi:hypothetical protein